MTAPWTTADIPDQTGRVAVITGANSGLGKEMTLELARKGARVIMAVRSLGKGQAAADEIRATVPMAELEVKELDLASLESIQGFADELKMSEPVIDVLVNNAGVMMPPKGHTIDGFETQFGTNYLGHFALTGHLLETVAKGSDPRIVNVSSIEHRPGKIDFDDIQKDKNYAPREAYQQSKLANTIFGLELHRRLQATGSPVISVLAHPGYSDTNLQSTGPTGLMALLMKVGNKVVAQKVDQGVLPQLHAATAPSVRSGQFFGPDGKGEIKGAVTEVQPAPQATDEETATRLWTISQDLTGVTFL